MFCHFHQLFVVFVRQLKPRNKTSLSPKWFFLCTQNVFAPHPRHHLRVVLTSLYFFFISQTCLLAAQYCGPADWFIYRKLIFPLDTFSTIPERKEQGEKSRSQAVYFGCSVFYQLGPCDFLSDSDHSCMQPNFRWNKRHVWSFHPSEGQKDHTTYE